MSGFSKPIVVTILYLADIPHYMHYAKNRDY